VAAGLGWALGWKFAPLLALPGMAQFLLALASVEAKRVSR
jgi:hypothetical protein